MRLKNKRALKSFYQLKISRKWRKMRTIMMMQRVPNRRKVSMNQVILLWSQMRMILSSDDEILWRKSFYFNPLTFPEIFIFFQTWLLLLSFLFTGCIFTSSLYILLFEGNLSCCDIDVSVIIFCVWACVCFYWGMFMLLSLGCYLLFFIIAWLGFYWECYVLTIFDEL